MVEHKIQDWKAAGSIPGMRGCRIFLSRFNILCRLLFCSTLVITVALKRPRSFLPKVLMAPYTKTYTLDLMKYEWAEYAVQA